MKNILFLAFVTMLLTYFPNIHLALPGTEINTPTPATEPVVPGTITIETTPNDLEQQTKIKQVLTDNVDMEDQAYDLIEVLDEYSNVIPSEETKNVAFQTLSSIYKNRLQYYASTMGKETDIANLNLLLFNAKDSNFFTDTHKKSIDTFLETGNIEELLFDSINQDTYEKQLTKLGALLPAAADKTFNPITQDIFANNIALVFEKHTSQDLKFIPRLKTILTKSLTTPLLTPEKQSTIQQYLNTLQMEEETRAIQLKLQSEIKDAMALPDLNEKIAAIEAIINENAGKPIDKTSQELLAQSLRNLYEARQLDPVMLANLSRLMTTAQTNTLIDPVTQATIQTGFLPTIIADQDKATLHEQVKNADQAPDADSQISALQNIAQAATEKPVDPQTQALAAKQLQDLFNTYYQNRNLDSQELTNLNSLMNTMQQSPLLSPETQQTIQTTMLPILASDQEALRFEQEIHMAMAKPKTIDRINGVAEITNRYFNKNFSERIQAFFAQTLQTIFDERYATDIILQDAVAKAPQVKRPKTKQTKKIKQTKATVPGKKTQKQKQIKKKQQPKKPKVPKQKKAKTGGVQ